MENAREIKEKIKERSGVILICCHISNKKSIKLLRDLVDSIEENGFEFLISSHTTVPADILERSCGSIFDPDNYKIQLKPTMYFWTQVGGYKITSKFLDYGSIVDESYVLAAMKNRTNGNSLAYSLGYKIVHLVEYDSIPNFGDLRDNEKILNEGKDLVVYKNEDSSMSGNVFSYSLTEKSKRFHTDFLCWIDELEKESFFSEECFFNFAKKQDLIITQKSKSIQPEGLITSFLNSGHVESVLFRFQNSGNIFLFLRNNGSGKKVIIYSDKFRREIDMPPGFWIIMDLETEVASYVHIYQEKKLVKKWDVSTPENFYEFVSSNKIENI
jgi:hypothetical protein